MFEFLAYKKTLYMRRCECGKSERRLVMSVGGVYGVNGFTGYYGVNPNKDKVYTNPRTGDRSTWQPGLYTVPTQESQKRVKRNRFFALALAAGLAFIFRGKIKQGYNLLKPYFVKVVNPVKNFVKTKTFGVFKAIKNLVGKFIK